MKKNAWWDIYPEIPQRSQREKSQSDTKRDSDRKKKRGRPKKGEERPPKELSRLERQSMGMSLEEMLNELPKSCDVGTKTDSKGHKVSWIGYKFHIDWADGEIPISCLLTSASLHDSQAGDAQFPASDEFV
jgi:hypothetical protein